MITAVGFDLDDTLLDHSVAVALGLSSMVQTRGWPQRGDDLALWRELEKRHYPRYVSGEITFLDQRRERLSAFVSARGIAPDSLDIDATFVEYFSHYETHWEAVAGARDLLAAQRDAGRRIGVLTNGPRALQETKLQRIGLADLVDVLLAVDDLPEAKPSPAAYEALCESLECQPSEIVYVGDDLEIDARGARAAGLESIWFRREGAIGFSAEPADDVRIAHDLLQVAELLA